MGKGPNGSHYYYIPNNTYSNMRRGKQVVFIMRKDADAPSQSCVGENKGFLLCGNMFLLCGTMYPMCGMSQYSAPEGSAQHQPPSEEGGPGKPASSGVAAGTPGAAYSPRGRRVRSRLPRDRPAVVQRTRLSEADRAGNRGDRGPQATPACRRRSGNRTRHREPVVASPLTSTSSTSSTTSA